MIEIYYKNLQIYILPKVRNHQHLKKAAGIYISRKASIADFRLKTVRIFKELGNEKKNT